MAEQHHRVMAIAATFTAEPLLPSLNFVLHEAGIPHAISFSPYNQVFQELLSDASALTKNSNGINVILLRVEDFVRDIEETTAAVPLISRTLQELASALGSYAHRTTIPTLLAVLPASPGANPSLLTDLNSAQAELVSIIESLSGITLISPDEIDRVSEGERYDPVSDKLAHIPYTEQYYASISLAIARKAHSLLVPSHKVLVLDCDNTLWKGVVGEDGVDGISITPAFARLQQFAVKAHSQGVLVCLVSKNAERDVQDVFEKNSEMILRTEHIVTHRINWDGKPQNIASLAQALNLGLDSFVFLDDNPVECGLMQAELPQVLTLQVPPESEIESFLAHLWVFDRASVTDEDSRRTQMYRENAARLALETSVGDIGQFISSLQVVIEIDQPTDREWARLSQLTQRTNQFNFTTTRRTESELRSLAAQAHHIFRVRVRDRFGEYGLVGVMIASPRPDALHVDTFLLSCRVLGRGVEHAMLRKLGGLANELGLAHVYVRYLETSRNEPARAFIDSVAARFRADLPATHYLIPSEVARGITHRPGEDPEAVMAASKTSDVKNDASKVNSSPDVSRADRYFKLARELTSGLAVQRALAAQALRPRTLSTKPTMARSETEQKMLVLWQEVLGISGLGIDDDYFALGGSSLLAARLFAEITRRFGIQLPLTTILGSPTVRALVRQIESQATTQNGSLVELKPGHTRNLFLVHDGDGETLLYSNLARRLPDDIAVFGVEPRRIVDVPLSHTRIEDMAAFYIKQIQNKQPEGPYLLGGMCAGGVIAYEMAQQLTGAGETVGLVAILDAATPQAPRRAGRIAKQRLGRFGQLFAPVTTSESTTHHLHTVMRGIAIKAWNVTSYELASLYGRWSTHLRFGLLKSILHRHWRWPRALPPLTARQIYECAESSYVPKPVADPNILLVRAKVGEAGDTPYREIYADEALGWGNLAPGLSIADVDGGHFSMLQEPFVESLAQTLETTLSEQSSQPRLRSQIKEAV